MIDRSTRSGNLNARGARLGVLALAALFAMAGSCNGGGNTGGPQHPIVLAHGALGMESYGPLDYWFGIVDALEDEGATVYVTEVSALGDSFVRGAQLQAQVESIVAESGAAKVHLIGHSQGGLDSRYVAGMRPDLVASVTTIGSPHQGADIAAFIADGIAPDGSIGGALLSFFGGLLEDVIVLLTGTDLPQDADAALAFLGDLSAFNATFPEGLPAGCHDGPSEANGVRFFSWTGDTVLTNALDATDPLLGVTGLFYGFQPNDGLVTVCSAQFGEVIDDGLRMNHLDEVNQILGIVSLLERNPRGLFREHSDRLADLGL